jgi:hypothetical protein
MLILKTFPLSVVLLLIAMLSHAVAQEHSVELINTAPEAEGVSEEVAKEISDHGLRVKRGSTRTVCEIWFRKDLPLDPDFTATPQRLYPFTEGQLIGLLHFPRRGSEFRDQTVSSGWYTLRFGLQPVDGNHIGTSPTRDFLVLIEAEKDEFLENWEVDDLQEASAEAAGSSHPAMMCLQRPSEGSDLAIRHDEASDWWIVHMVVKAAADGKPRELPLDLVVVGHAAE